ncbi:FAD binding domain-containing protein [Halocalculus aciditolerans]|uniref:Carbon monoxide dehydrogenase n=1 Tax=Halocalculus aciditolerans TaxID=1383812 RepID=A0A830FAQ1_9EURY|nr:xanthine dehydrogenase family protein subunit M [Halocalculus aciditolerans]GGL56372.1 carbon monoxide dehydrogenase [Halocalculus aciditolerans]
MFPKQFDYYEASNVAEAFDLMDEHSDENAELLAGGHSLLPTMKSGLASPDALIDIGGIADLRGIEEDGDSTRIGALTHYADIADHDGLHEHAPALADAASQVGDVQVRNRGTIGGNLAHADPASDLPGAALAADATLLLESRDGSREVPADEFFLGMYATDVGPGELVTGVRVPHEDSAGGAYAKKPSPSSGYAMVGVAATVEVEDGTVTSARIGANGAMDHGVRLQPVEDELVGGPATEDAAEAAGEHAADDLDVDFMMDDNQASAEFRAQLLSVYTGRAVAAAIERAT